jgi:glycosyltransferase involved in cell wall biosynthesis
MKIGLSTSVMQRGKSGVGQYVLALVRSIQQAAGRHDLTLFVLEQDLPLFAFVSPSVRLVTVPEKYRHPVRNILWHQFKLPRLARELELDVVHVPSYRRMISRAPCALVATIHDLAPFRLPGKYDWLRMFYGRVVARWLAGRQDRIIAVSEFTAEDIATFFRTPRERIQVIRNGLDHGRFHPGDRAGAKRAVAASYGLNKPFLLYVARFEHPAKNHVRLIEAFERFRADTGRDWELVLGGSDWHGAEVIHRAIRSSPAAAAIRTLGFVGDGELPTLYRAADLFVFPSLFEGFGLPPAEAMACGCPVLSSPRGALGEVLGDAAIRLDPENIGEMAQRIAELAGDAPARQRLTDLGFKQAALFDWGAAATATLEVYSAAIAQHRMGSLPEGMRVCTYFRNQL